MEQKEKKINYVQNVNYLEYIKIGIIYYLINSLQYFFFYFEFQHLYY